MESPSPLISWVNPFPSRFINRTIFFCDALESHECACCLLSFLYFHWLFPLLARETSSGNRACVGDGGSIWCLVDPRPCTLGLFRASETNLRNKLNGLRIQLAGGRPVGFVQAQPRRWTRDFLKQILTLTTRPRCLHRLCCSRQLIWNEYS